MSLSTNRTTFTFNHAGQVDEYGASVGNYATVQENFDSRAEENLTDINNIKTTLVSETADDSGAHNVKSAGIAGLLSGAAASIYAMLSALKGYIDTAAANFQLGTLLDGSVTDVKLSDTAGQIKETVTTHLADYVLIDTDVVADINAKLLDAATNNKWVRFIKNTYEINGSIIIPSNSIIYWRHTTIKRKAGSGAFDLIKNLDAVLGNSSILMYNLTIDGNKDVDSLVAETEAHRFSGLRLEKVTASELHNITVTGTVNAEDQAVNPAAGIWFKDCTDIDAYNINGYGNDKTAIMLTTSKVRIFGSYTHDNLGSGISSNAAHGSEYHNIYTHDNGYSNLSVNGLKSIVDNVYSYNSGYSGVNIGHDGNPSDDSVIGNIISFDNTYEGLTISNSKHVHGNNINLWGNVRNNALFTYICEDIKMLNFTSKNSAGGEGLKIDNGKNYYLDNYTLAENYGNGAYIGAAVDNVKFGDNGEIYNNGQGASANSAGITFNTATNCEVGRAKIYDNQGVKTQESGVWIAGGSGHRFYYPEISGNKTYQIRKTGTPTNLITILPPTQPVAMVGINGYTLTNATYYRDSEGYTVVEGESSGGTSPNSLFQLPLYFRPAKTETFATVANNAFAYCEVTVGGDIKPYVSVVSHKFKLRFKAVV
jgi:hypothetical protein